MLLTAAHLFLELTKTKTVQVAEAPAAAAPAHQLLLRNEDFGETLRSSIPALLRELPKDSIVSISCIDYRIGELPGYHLTSAGNIPHGALVEDLHLVLPEKKLLLLSCHTDCAKSKTQLPRMEGETEESYSVRLEAHTLARLWSDAERLLKDPQIRQALQDGLRFCAARYDVRSGKTEYFEEQSKELVTRVAATH